MKRSSLKRIVMLSITCLSLVLCVCNYGMKKYVIAAGDSYGNIRLLDIDTGRFVKSLQSNGQAFALTFNKRGTQLFASTQFGKIQTFDLHKKDPVKTPVKTVDLNINAPVMFATPFSLSSDGKFFALGDKSGKVKIWNVNSKKIIKEFKNNASVTVVSFSRDGMYIAAGLLNKSIKIWDIKRGECVKTFSNVDPDGILSLVLGKKYIVFASLGRKIKVLDRETGQLIKRFSVNKKFIFSLAVSPDEAFVAVVDSKIPNSVGAAFKIWNLKTGAFEKSFSKRYIFGGKKGCVTSLAFRPFDDQASMAKKDVQERVIYDIEEILPQKEVEKVKVKMIEEKKKKKMDEREIDIFKILFESIK